MTDASGPMNREPIESWRKTAFVAGVLYLITFVTSIPAVFLLDPVLNNPNYVVTAGADSQVIFGCSLDLLNALACIGTAVALFSLLKRQHEGFALGFVTTRMFEAAVIVIGVVSLVGVVSLRQAGAGAASAASLVAAGQALVGVRNATFLLGPGLMPAFNALLLGYLMYRSRLVPRLIPAMGLIGAPLLMSSTIGTMFGVNNAVSVWTGIATVPIFFWELSLGLWMTIKGFDRSAPLIAGAAEGTSSSRTAVPSRTATSAHPE